MIIDYSHAGVVEVGSQFLNDSQRLLLKTAKSSIIDRTETLDLGIDITVLDHIPTGTTTKTFEEICDLEAKRLIEFQRPLVVYWSGGIDSTLALISLMKAGAEDLTIVLTGASIMEYPWFYNTYIKDKMKIRRVTPSIVPDVDPNEIIVTGEFGDQAMGSFMVLNYPDFGSITKDPWQPWIEQNYGGQYVEIITEQVAKAPFPIISVFDYLWWMNYSCKWQHVLLRMGGTDTTGLNTFIGNVQHFYRSDEFQRWSMDETNHRTLKVQDTPASYKHVMKAIIADFTKDTEYQRTKLKLGSLRDTTANNFLFKLDTGLTIRHDEFNESHYNLFTGMN